MTGKRKAAKPTASVTDTTAKTGVPYRQWRPKFLKVLGETGRVLGAAAAAGIDRSAAYRARRGSSKFAAQWDEAREAAVEVLEAEAYRRGVEGVEKPLTVAGQREVVREYSDVLLIFLLKANAPQKYRENLHIDGNVEHKHKVKFIVATEGERREAVMVMLEHGLLPSPTGVDSGPEPVGPDKADR